MSCLRWGITISVPGAKKGSTKRVLVHDKVGEMTFTSQGKARDYMKAATGSRIDPETAQPKVVRVKVTTTMPK